MTWVNWTEEVAATTTTTATAIIIIRMSLWLRRDTEWRAGWWLICNILSDSSTSIVSPSSSESFALALKLKINTLKVTIIERSLIDVWIFFNRIISKTGAIGWNSLLSTSLYMSCVLCPSKSSKHKRKKNLLIACLLPVRSKIESHLNASKNNNPHFTWRVVNEYESIKRHVDVFTSIMALIYNKQEWGREGDDECRVNIESSI